MTKHQTTAPDHLPDAGNMIQQTTDALRWVEAGAGWIASCGEMQQGEAIVRDAKDGGYLWQVDMLPGDIEPVIHGVAYTVNTAKWAAEQQAAQWPALIEGACRHE